MIAPDGISGYTSNGYQGGVNIEVVYIGESNISPLGTPVPTLLIIIIAVIIVLLSTASIFLTIRRKKKTANNRIHQRFGRIYNYKY